MATTSVMGTARSALYTAINTGALASKVFYEWPGPTIDILEFAYITADPDSWRVTIPNIKSGRVQRQEEFTLDIVLVVADQTVGAATAQTVFERALTLIAVIDDALANDVQLGSTAFQYAVAEEREINLEPYERAWVCRAVLHVQFSARLT